MKKQWIALTIALCVLCISAVAAFAVPQTISRTDSGNVNNLIICNNVANGTATTFEPVYALSGSGIQGATVSLFGYNPSGDNMSLLSAKTADGSVQPVQWQIGPSGLFLQEVRLAEGSNLFALYAEKDGNVQITQIEIERMNEDFFSVIKGIKVDLTKIYDSIVSGS